MKFISSVLILTLVSSLGFAKGGAGGSKPFEARVHFGSSMKETKDFEEKMETYVTGVPDMGSPQQSGVDFLYQFQDVVIGLRYERLEFKDSEYSRQPGIGGTIKKVDVEMSGSRAGLLLGWRPLQWSQSYFGFLAHAAQSLGVDYKLKAQNTTTNATEEYEFKGSKDLSYGVGIETGFTLQDKLNIGLEAGYTSFGSKSFTDKSGAELMDSNGEKVSMNFSGLYGKLLLGVSF